MKIVNAVALACFNHRLDLQAVQSALPKSVFYLQEHPQSKRVIWKFKKITFIFFESGRILCLGAKGSKQAIQSLKKAIKALIMNGFIAKLDELKINVVNLIACEELNFNINLEELALKLERCIYEPDQFPALIYRDVNNATFLIFSCGKIVVAGLKNEVEAKKTIENFIKNLGGKINE